MSLFAGLLAITLAPPADAAFMITVTETGGAPIPIADDGPFDTNTTDPGVIAVDTAALNLLLTNFRFGTLGATSIHGTLSTNGPSELSQEGSVSRVAGTGGVQMITIQATDNDYLAPDGNPKFLDSGATANFRNTAAGDAQTFQSFFDPANMMDAMTLPSPLLTFLAPAGTGPFPDAAGAPTTLLGTQPIPFGLTNTMIITLGAATSSNQPSNQFTGATVVTAISQNGPLVPEPSTLALAGMGALGLVGVIRRRKRS